MDKYLLSGIEDMWGIYETGGKKIFILRPIKYRKGSFPVMVKGNIRDSESAFFIKLNRDYDMKPIKSRISQPFRVAISGLGFKETSVYIDAKSSHYPLANPLAYPLLELLLPNILSSGRGALFHACGIVEKGKAYLFLGHSGYGKSTMARLWKKSGCVVFHDDFIPVRKINGSYMAFPIPGYTENFDKSFLNGVPISKVFFIVLSRVCSNSS
ncbi:MAG: hypothetical protein PHW98_06195 [Candidatus Omnitrophica bacterium]|nr:hypothetical protein [Candidatus Omnitrophota bacterium]